MDELRSSPELLKEKEAIEDKGGINYPECELEDSEGHAASGRGG